MQKLLKIGFFCTMDKVLHGFCEKELPQHEGVLETFKSIFYTAVSPSIPPKSAIR